MSPYQKTFVALLVLCAVSSVLAVLSFQAGRNDFAVIACNAAMVSTLLSVFLVKFLAVRISDVRTYGNLFRGEDLIISVPMVPALFVAVEILNSYEHQSMFVRVFSGSALAIFVAVSLIFGLRKLKI